jgi:hypothetical protein
MNAGKANTREHARRSNRIALPDAGASQFKGVAGVVRTSVKMIRKHRRALAAAAIAAGLQLHLAPASAQRPSMLDERVTQQNIGATICRPGYAETVSPPFDDLMEHKDRLLAERGIDPDRGTRYALDRRVPIVLGGSPDAPDNLDLLPWVGHRGERRKALLTAKLKRCVCEGRMSLSEAQAAIAGNWSAHYTGFGSAPCGGTDDTNDAGGTAGIDGNGS